MREVFYEETAMVQNQRSCLIKYYILRVFSIISYVFAVLSLLLAFLFPLNKDAMFISLLIAFIPAIIFLISGIMFGKFKNKVYVEYDYTFVTGSVRVSKVMNNSKRKHMFKFEASDIERIGNYGSQTYLRYEKSPGIIKNILTSNISPAEGKDLYYIVAFFGGDKHLMVFECTQLFLSNILKFTNKGIIEEEFAKK